MCKLSWISNRNVKGLNDNFMGYWIGCMIIFLEQGYWFVVFWWQMYWFAVLIWPAAGVGISCNGSFSEFWDC